MKQEFIYAYKEMPDDLNTNGIVLLDWEDLPEINRVLNGQYRFYGNYSRKGEFRSYLKKGNFIKAKVPDGSWQYFEIYNVKKNLNSVSVTARHIGFMANKNFIIESFTDNGNGTQIMNNLKSSLAFSQKFNYLSNVGTTHQFTAKQVAPVEAIIGSNNGNENLASVASAELDMNNYDLNLVKQIGADNGFRIDFGLNLEAIEEEIDEESIVNSLFLVGGVPDNDYDEDKDPITYGFLEIDGVTDENRRIGKRENSDCKTIDELKKWGNTLFENDRIHEPKATHTVSMVSLEHTLEYGEMYRKLSTLSFGDVVHVRAKQLDIEITERVVEYTYFPTLGKYKDLVLGNDLTLYTSTVNSQTQELKKKIDNRTETLVQNVLNATAWITGNSGGHVVFRPEKAPSEILIMDTDNVASAKRVWRWNLKGLGYSDNGINGPFGIAITSKGEIVADFIKVGTINAEVFETSFNAYGDVLKLVKGTLQIWNENKKIMELTKKGMEFWNRKESIGTIGTTDSAGNPFPNAVTPTPLEENSLVIRTNGDGKYILISPTAEKGFVLLGNGKAYYFGDLDIQGKLTVRGKEVIPGQNGGPSGGGETPGGYPDELKTDAEKRAWRIYDILCNNGFTKQSACGILGNIQQETGGTFDPDTVQIGGPAYGLVQWDGSSYPLVGPATWDGKVYVQNLFNAAGIKEPITSLDAQVRLLIWTFTNGQWMGVVQPTTVDGFKACTDPRQAAYAFERNYERPAATHPERQDYAVNWYNKFKDLKPGGATGEAGLKRLESLIGQRIGNGQCYGLSAEYSGYLGGCGMGAGTKYGLTHVIGNTSAASDIGIAYDWSAVGWKVIQNPRYDQLVVGAIINWARGGQVGSWFADPTYGHTGVIRGLENGRIQTYEQNTELGMICGKLDRQFYNSNNISSIVIPPK
ncbi:phage tail protein [Enterococcus faecium]|uniref:phage tail tip lysozyme n=3 Tax=Enterococcus faecium TaxID=1352 RepID=UPI0007AEA2E8|nr:phage tail tip lysozyme [Enterococcus faecium]EGU6560596.1 CHAP domain-containing protein [Enterococcus faecium]EHQ9056288.1 phage tail protein [Enterococcus faecium]KZK35580.1 phage minor structural protein [Enterococcus faecium]MDQ8386912.1 phage tail tip lysozyme [Enterococcus faecium]MDQ8461841.1 phage tail tip lysozyme [Enterococcus faecium]